ncbi:MAG: chitobiase/beta-hexosaminidase C-terminal domain-containing protein [Spirochaetales bacterium]|nr:chitobiase/beta-hexosaminidase C-terminal domain-containing protein [Spirochaetales bacterium]
MKMNKIINLTICVLGIMFLLGGCVDPAGITGSLPGYPHFTPDPDDEYTGSVSVIINQGYGAAVYYTTDGSVPTLSSPMVTGPLVLTENTVLKAAASYGGDFSEVVTASYNVTPALPVVAPPVISPTEREIVGSIDVTITAEAGAVIHYTINDSNISEDSPVYTSPFTIEASGPTVRAIAIVDGIISEIASVDYYYREPSVLSDESFWGRWKGIGTEVEWYISDDELIIDDEDGMDFLSADDSTIVFSGGTLTKESEDVIRYVRNISGLSYDPVYYLYRETGPTSEVTFLVEDSSDTLSSLSGLDVKVSNVDNYSDIQDLVTDSEGRLTASNLIPGDLYRFSISTGTESDTFNTLGRPLGDSEEWSPLDLASALTEETPFVNIYIDSEEIGRELIADGATAHAFTLIFHNIGTEDLKDAYYTLDLPDGLTLTDGDITNTIGNLYDGYFTSKIEVDIKLNCDPIDTEYIDKTITLTVGNAFSSSRWEEAFTLRFYAMNETFVINSETEGPVLNGLVLDPNGTPRRLEDGADLPWIAGEWTAVLGGGGTSAGTRYSLGLDTTALTELSSASVGDGEPDNILGEAFELPYGGTILRYMGSYDVDFFSFTMPERQDLIGASLVFDGNGDDGGGSVPSTIEAEALDTILLPGNMGSLVKSGFLFAGWSREASPADILVSNDIPGSIELTAGENKLYAVWLPLNTAVAGESILRSDGTLFNPGTLYTDPEILLEDVSEVHSLWVNNVDTGRITVAKKDDGSFWKQDGTGDFISFSSSYDCIEDGFAVAELGFQPQSFVRGYDFSLAVDGSGVLWAEGENSSGELGTGGSADNDEYDNDSNMTSVSSVAAGRYHSLVLKDDNTLWVSGGNDDGQHGDGTSVDVNDFKQVASGVKKIFAIGYTSFYIDNSDALWAAGMNSSGQLGLASDSPVRTFEKVMDGAFEVISNGETTLFKKLDGTLWASGENYYGQLGIGSRENQYSPVFITDDAVSVTIDGQIIKLLKSDGTVWTCYGSLQQIAP